MTVYRPAGTLPVFKLNKIFGKFQDNLH